MSTSLPAEPLLSDEETNALLDAMREDERGSGSTPTSKVELVDPERALRARLRQADTAGRPVATAARAQLLKQLGRGVDVTSLPSELVPYEVLENGLDPHGLRYDLGADGESIGLMSFDASLVRFVLDRCMGAPELPAVGGRIAPPRFSDLDRRVFAPLPAAVAAALGPVVGRTLELGAAAEEPRGARFEPLLRMSWRLATPLGELGQIVTALRASAFGVSAPARATAADPWRERLARAEVEVCATLGTIPSTIRELLSLCVGDVLRLDAAPSDPLPVLVEDVEVARGVPVVRTGNLALEITRRGNP